MSGETGSHATDDAVVARLRDAAHAVPRVQVDPAAVLTTAKRALRRRRRRQSVAGVLIAGLLALMATSPVHLPGVGTVTMPGGHQVRAVLGVGDPAGPARAPGIDLGELFAHLDFGQPSPERMAEEVANLQRYVLPVLEEIRPTWYEHSSCDILEYPRGTFSDDGACGGRPAERRFDDVARADLDRILDAVDRSGVPTDELMSAQYAPDGGVLAAGFLRSGGGIEWNFAYLYSPVGQPRERETALGPVTVTPIGNTGWWFEKAPND